MVVLRRSQLAAATVDEGVPSRSGGGSSVGWMSSAWVGRDGLVAMGRCCGVVGPGFQVEGQRTAAWTSVDGSNWRLVSAEPPSELQDAAGSSPEVAVESQR